ncbi:hypothetical protein [Streptomyces sp. NPDC048196]|uniref:hypothetical protein n=1 Tax=Streptomyces sp. NPDC048196 TaxID=3154712 RepID=UPI0033CFF85A
MPLAVVLIGIGVLLLILALIGSGISRRLMTIPKMHRTPRVVVAVLGILLLFAGGWTWTTEKGKEVPTVADLRAHIPTQVSDNFTCTEGSEAPKGAVTMDCTASEGAPDQGITYTMFQDVNSMQDRWLKQATPEQLTGSTCDTENDYANGGNKTYVIGSAIVGDTACYEDTNGVAWNVYTDRRFNIVVELGQGDPQKFSDFLAWSNLSQPVGGSDSTPATPTQPPAAAR